MGFLGERLRRIYAPWSRPGDFPGTKAPWEQTGETEEAWEARHAELPVEGCRCLACEARRIAERP